MFLDLFKKKILYAEYNWSYISVPCYLVNECVKENNFFWNPIDNYFAFLQINILNCLWNLKQNINTFLFSPLASLAETSPTHVFFATLQSHLITMISTCSPQISWKPQSPWVKSKWLIHKAIQLAVNLEFVFLHLFSAHLLFFTSTKYKASCCCDRCNTKFCFKILQTCHLGFWGKWNRAKKEREEYFLKNRISYLLFVVRCIRQHGGNMEHNFIVLIRCIQRMSSSGVSCHKGKNE